MDETTILIVDDEPRVLDALEAILAAEFRVLRAGHGEEALARLAAEPDVAVIVTDHRMPGMTGVELLRRSQEHTPDAVRIVLTAYTDVDSLMEAINTGRIYHFVPKPWDPNGLLVVVRRAAERWHLARENGRLRDELELAYNALRREAAAGREKPPSFDALVGAASGLRAAVELAGKVLDGDTTVLLLGETGTGKEVFAHLIHAQRPPPGQAVRGPELRRPARLAARVRAVRARAGRLHRRHRRAQGPLRGGPRRHDLPRRGRRDLARDAAPPPARAPGGRGAAGRRQQRRARSTCA